MTEKISKDVSLLRCVVKKSASVIEKVMIYGSYVIVAIAVLVSAGWLAWNGFNAVLPVLNQVWAFLVAVPWYVYVGIVTVLAIPVYSLVWCMARNLEEEDWKSDTAENFALAALALAALALSALALAALAPLSALALAALAPLAALSALALAALAALALAPGSKAFLFIGAYLHYRKRIKNTTAKEQERD